MENIFVVVVNSRPIGVYTSHRKAVQGIIMYTLPFGYTMTDYVYDFGVEFYTFSDKTTETIYELHEFTPDERV